jgi:hypothetical protein
LSSARKSAISALRAAAEASKSRLVALRPNRVAVWHS